MAEEGVDRYLEATSLVPRRETRTVLELEQGMRAVTRGERFAPGLVLHLVE